MGFVLATLIALCVGVANLLDDSHWIKEAFTKECSDDHIN